ncbi:dipeptidase 1-like [Ctenocephalides felis]|uniref:dipeptidase 1-like n=1 Tax=Ctenocephalides felis TaxID=7515 RepID=UPI000E6E494B|nr:dipeptidase 1-like [Ctenocephalides felis]
MTRVTATETEHDGMTSHGDMTHIMTSYGMTSQLMNMSSSVDNNMVVIRKILKETPLIDGHNDLAWNLRKFLKNQLRDFQFSDLGMTKPWSNSVWSHTDLRRAKQGLLGAQFWSAYAPCSSQYLDAVQLTLEQIDVIRRLISQNNKQMRLVTSADGIEEAHRLGFLGSLIGVEGGHSIGNSLGVLRSFYDLGVRYLTLTHTCNTPWADCCLADEPGRVPHIGGLSNFGKAVIREMNRLGMLVDLSHVSQRVMLATLRQTEAPVIFSHSSAHQLCNNSRNVPDYILKKLAENGGIVMVAFYPHFVSCSSNATLLDVAAHIEHIREVAGIDHVGIGAGYDGVNLVPRGLEDVSRYPFLFQHLLATGRWSEMDLKKLAGQNLLRVLRQVENVRDRMSIDQIQPLDVKIPEQDVLGRVYCKYGGKIT